MVDRHKIGKNSKARGSGYEKSVSDAFSAWYGSDEAFYHTPGSGSKHWATSMNVFGDVISIPEIGFNYLIECKRYEGWTIENLLKGNLHFPSWVAQAVREGDMNGKVPLLIYKRRATKSFVTMPYNKDIEVDPLIIKTISYTSEITHGLEQVKTMTCVLDDLLEKYDYDSLNSLYKNKDWKNNIKKLEEPKIDNEEPIDDMVDNLINKAK